jgi:hypothetical protein
LAAKLEIKKPEQWYKVKKKDVLELGGVGLLKHYGNSVSKASLENFSMLL